MTDDLETKEPGAAKHPGLSFELTLKLYCDLSVRGVQLESALQRVNSRRAELAGRLALGFRNRTAER